MDHALHPAVGVFEHLDRVYRPKDMTHLLFLQASMQLLLHRTETRGTVIKFKAPFHYCPSKIYPFSTELLADIKIFFLPRLLT